MTTDEKASLTALKITAALLGFVTACLMLGTIPAVSFLTAVAVITVFACLLLAAPICWLASL